MGWDCWWLAAGVAGWWILGVARKCRPGGAHWWWSRWRPFQRLAPLATGFRPYWGLVVGGFWGDRGWVGGGPVIIWLG